MRLGKTAAPSMLVLALIGGVAAAQPPAVSPGAPWLDAKLTPEARAQAVVDHLKTVDAKVAFIDAPPFGPGSEKGMASLGLKRGGGSDGPAGPPGGTAWPAPLALAASFDPALAARYGAAVGEEFFQAGLNGMTGPTLDIARTWRAGRTAEALGEDPVLTAAIAAPEIKAMQARHVVATVKHFAAYVQERGRTGDPPFGTQPSVDVRVDPRALHEIYLPAFKAAVTQGGAGDVMCAFPRINGVYACEHPLLGELKAWGFDGAVGPDFPDGQRSVAAAINAGLDGGIFEPQIPHGPPGLVDNVPGHGLAESVRAGVVTEARLDDLIRRRLVPGFRFGVFEHPAPAAPGGGGGMFGGGGPPKDVSTPAARALAEEMVIAGAVLLKNDRGVLPFGPGVRSVAVIGAEAGPHATVVAEGSPRVAPMHLTPAEAALRARGGAATRVSYAPGGPGLDELPVAPAALFHTPSGEAGLLAEYVANPRMDFAAPVVLRRVEAGVNVSQPLTQPELPANNRWSARWRGIVTPATTGLHRFTLTGVGSAELIVGGRSYGRFEGADFGDILYANVSMAAGQPQPIEVRWTPRVAPVGLVLPTKGKLGTEIGPVVKLGWAAPDGAREAAVAAAKAADVAVVFAGHRIGEGRDRTSLSLPSDQDALIEAIAAANPHTIVMLQTGGPVAMPWLPKVQAVLETWLCGDACGTAAAKLLFGDAAPAGRLPMTFPADETQGPGSTPETYPGVGAADGSLDHVTLSEGLKVGYRFFDAQTQKPLFPFGYGLGYTTFAVSRLQARPAAGGGAQVTATVRNTGKRTGSDVVQAYLAFPASAGEPPWSLKGFAKVALQPGESRTVTIPLAADAFQTWSAAGGWKRVTGAYRVALGHSGDAPSVGLTIGVAR